MSSDQSIQQHNISAPKSPHNQQSYITETLPNDVLLGRGSHLVKYVGNVEFRRLIQSRRDDYIYAENASEKDAIAQEIVNITNRNKGRFLRKVMDPDERKKLKIPINVTSPWVLANTEVVLEKIKQAFRDTCKDDPAIKQAAKSSGKRENTSSDQISRERSSSNVTAVETPQDFLLSQTLQQQYQQEQRRRMHLQTRGISLSSSPEALSNRYLAASHTGSNLISGTSGGENRNVQLLQAGLSLHDLVEDNMLAYQIDLRSGGRLEHISRGIFTENAHPMLRTDRPFRFHDNVSSSASSAQLGSNNDLNRALLIQQQALNVLRPEFEPRISSMTPSLLSPSGDNTTLLRQMLQEQPNLSLHRQIPMPLSNSYNIFQQRLLLQEMESILRQQRQQPSSSLIATGDDIALRRHLLLNRRIQIASALRLNPSTQPRNQLEVARTSTTSEIGSTSSSTTATPFHTNIAASLSSTASSPDRNRVDTERIKKAKK